jgi:tight adherence protein C
VSRMTAVVFLGAGCGLGILLIVHSLTARERLSDVGATLALPGRPALATDPPSRSKLLEQRAVRHAVDLLRAAGMDPARRASDLRVSRRTVDQHVFAKLVAGLGFAVLTGLVAFLLGLGPIALVVGLVAGAGGFLLPEITLTGEARDARKSFRHAYGAYLDLVNVQLAAGAGAEQALHRAADSGAGWAFAEIRQALEAARRTRRSIADTLAELAGELEISELRELAASIALMGSQGAKVRASLSAKADSLRSAQLAETQAEAESATERMTLPVIVLLLGFLVFIAYPAVLRIGEIGS